MSQETLDEFLVELGMLETCEERAIKEIEQPAEGMTAKGTTSND